MIQQLHDFVPNLHMSIIAQTGAGKTFLAEKIFGNIPHRAIFFNYAEEKILTKYEWVSTKNIKLVPKLMKKHKKIVVTGQGITDIEAVVQYIWDFKHSNKDFAKEHIYLFFDEIQKYSQIQIIDDIFNMGRRWNIHGIAMSRQIQEMRNLSIISECTHHIFLRLNDVGYNSLRKNYKIQIPDEVRDWLNKGQYDNEGHFQSEYYCVLYDGVMFFIYDKDGNLITEYNPSAAKKIKGGFKTGEEILEEENNAEKNGTETGNTKEPTE